MKRVLDKNWTWANTLVKRDFRIVEKPLKQSENSPLQQREDEGRVEK